MDLIFREEINSKSNVITSFLLSSFKKKERGEQRERERGDRNKKRELTEKERNLRKKEERVVYVDQNIRRQGNNAIPFASKCLKIYGFQLNPVIKR